MGRKNDMAILINSGKVARRVIFCAGMALASGGCDKTPTRDKVKVQGMELLKDADINYHNNGALRYAQLAENTRIQGIKFDAFSTVMFSPERKLEWVYPKSLFVVQGMVFMPDTRIDFYKNGKVSGGMLAVGLSAQGMDFRKGDTIEFYDNGVVSWGFNASVQGMKFTGVVSFYRNGKVREGYLKESADINGMKFMGKGTITDGKVEFYESGKVRSGYLAESAERQGMKFQSRIELSEWGRVTCGTLAAPANIQGTNFNAGTNVSFSNKGTLAVIENIK